MIGVMSEVDAVTPSEAYEILQNDDGAVLIDVRTQAEWSFVGVPDLSGLGKQVWTIEWQQFPSMAQNASFLPTVSGLCDEARQQPKHMLFICRSGARSLHAAHAVLSGLGREGLRCTNVAEGFEGDLDQQRHRGASNGWKARGLPWAQS